MLGVAGTPSHDSPMRVSEVDVFPWVPSSLRALNDAGFGLCIATNQPAAAKGKTTRADLDEVHATVIAACERAGAKILSSHICFHRAEDGCACRKPKPGLLEAAFEANPDFTRAGSWMVGDRPVDVLAGAAAGLATAFLSSMSVGDASVGDASSMSVGDGVGDAVGGRRVRPTFQGVDLRDFERLLLGEWR